MFGAISSVGIYDRTAKVVLWIVMMRSGIPPGLVSQHLDDVCAAAPKDNDVIYNFDNEYKTVSEELGISLAPRDNPEKSFGPTHEGCVYGINYNTESQTWWLGEDKIARIQHQIKEVLESCQIEQKKIWSIAGKIIHIKDLVVGGRFFMEHLLLANSYYSDKDQRDDLIPISTYLKRELWWWHTMLGVCSNRSRYPDPDEALPSWSLSGYTDAAGGTSMSLGSGCGAVLGCWWTYIPWSDYINLTGHTSKGRKVARKLSALELIAPLAMVCGAPDIVRGQPLNIFVDNSGSVMIWKKGYSTRCELSSTLVRAIFQVSTALECRVNIVKITRCSNPEADMADALSKAELIRFRRVAMKENIHIQENMGTVPQALLDWVNDPKEDWFLGHNILNEISRETAVLGYNS